jgi:hypothetical protein
MDSNGSCEAGLLLVSESMLHQAQQAVGGAGYRLILLPLSSPTPLRVVEMGQVHLLKCLKKGYKCFFSVLLQSVF